ncbi:hypothetical protein BsWGS_26247 [Bradybaena similaris]
MAQVLEDLSDWLLYTDEPSSRTDAVDSGCGAECFSDDQERWYLVQFQLCTLGFSFVISITLISCGDLCVTDCDFPPSMPVHWPPPRRLPPQSRSCRSKLHSCNLRALLGSLHVVAHAWKPKSVARSILFIKDARDRLCRAFAVSTVCSRPVAMRCLNLAPTLRHQNSGNIEPRRTIFPTARPGTRFLSKTSRTASKGGTEMSFNGAAFAYCSFLNSALDALHKHEWRRIGTCASDYLYGSRKPKNQASSDCGVKRSKIDCLWNTSAGSLGKRNCQEVSQSDKTDCLSTISNRTVLVDDVSKVGSSKVRSAPVSEAMVSNSPYTPLIRFIHIGNTQRIMVTTHSLAGEKDSGGSVQCAPVYRPENLSKGIRRDDAGVSLGRIASNPDVDDATSDLLCGDVSQIMNKYALAKGRSGKTQAIQPGREQYVSRISDGHRCLQTHQLSKERDFSSRRHHIVNKKRDKYAPGEGYMKKGDTKYSDRLKKTIKSSISENTQTRTAHGQASEKMNVVTRSKVSSLLNDKLLERKAVGNKYNHILGAQTENMTCSVNQSRARNDKLVRPTDQLGKEKMVLETANQNQQMGKAKLLERKCSNSGTRGANSRVNQRQMTEAAEKTNPTSGGWCHLAVDELDLQVAARKQSYLQTSKKRRSQATRGLHAVPHRVSRTSKNLPQIPDTAAEHQNNKHKICWKAKSTFGIGDSGHDNLEENVDDAPQHLTKEKQQDLVDLITECSSRVHNAVAFQKCSFGRIDQCRSEWRGPYPRKSFVEKFQPYKVPRRSHSHVSRNGEPELNNTGVLEKDLTGGECVEVACVGNLEPSGGVVHYWSPAHAAETYLKGHENLDPGPSCKTCDTVAFLDLFLHHPAFFHHQKHPAGSVSKTKTFKKYLSSSPLAVTRNGRKALQQVLGISNQDTGKDRKMITGKEMMRCVSGVLGSPSEYDVKSNTAEGIGEQMKVDTPNIRDYLSFKSGQKKDLNSRVRQGIDGQAKVWKKSLHGIQTCSPSPERKYVKFGAEHSSVRTTSAHYRTSRGSSVVSTPHQVASQTEKQRSCEFHIQDMGKATRAMHKRGDKAGRETRRSQLLATRAVKTVGDKRTRRSRIPLPVHRRHQRKSLKLSTEEHSQGSPMDDMLLDNQRHRSSDNDEERLSRGSPQILSPLQKVVDAEAAAGMGKVKKKVKYQVFTTGLAKAEPQKVEEHKTKDELSKGRLELHEAIVDSNLKILDGKNLIQEHSNSKRTHREGEAWRADGQMDNSIFRYRLSAPTFTNKASLRHPARSKLALDRFNNRRGQATSAFGLRRSGGNRLGGYRLQTQASVYPPNSDSQDSSPICLPSKHKSLLSDIQKAVGLGEEHDTSAKMDRDIQDMNETSAILEMDSCADATWLHSASDEALLVSLDELDKRLENIHTQISDTTSRNFVKEAVELKMVTQEPRSRMRSRVPLGVRSDLARSTLKSTSHNEATNVCKSAEESRMRVEESRMRVEESRMRVEESRMRVEDSRMRALEAADLRMSKAGADGSETAQILPVTGKQKSTGTSKRQLPPSFTKRSISDHRAKLPGPGIRTFYHLGEEITPTERRLGSRRVGTKPSDHSFTQDKDASLSTPLAKMVMAALDRHSRCLSADMWKHTVELRKSMKHPRSLWKSKRHEDAGEKLLSSSSLASYPYKHAKTGSQSENLDGVTTAQETQQRPEGTLPKEVRQASSINDSGGENKHKMSSANIRDKVEPPNAGEERLLNANDSQDVRAVSSRQKTASKLPRLAGHTKTHILKQLCEHERSETTKEIDAKEELNCENATLKAKEVNTYENLNFENSAENVMRHADGPAPGFQRVANTKKPTSNTEWVVSSDEHRKLGSDGLMAPVNQAKTTGSRPDSQERTRPEQASEKRHSAHRPLNRARIGEDKPHLPETPTGVRSPVQPPASKTGNKTACPKSHGKDTIQSLSSSENPSCKKQKSICSNSSVNGARSPPRTEQVRSLTDQFTEVECPEEKQCRRTKLVRTVPEDALVSFWTRKPCAAAYDRPRKRSTTGSKYSSKDSDAKEKRQDVQQVSLPSYNIRGMGQFVVPGNLSVIKCEPREAHNPLGRLQGLFGEHQGSGGIQRSAENSVANNEVPQADSARDPRHREANLQDRDTTNRVHNVARVSQGNNIQEYAQSAEKMVSTATKGKKRESWPKQESKSDHSWKKHSCKQSCSNSRDLAESTTPGVLATISVPGLAGKDGQMRKASLADDKLPTSHSRLGEQASSREHTALRLWSVEPGRKQQTSRNRVVEDLQPCSHEPMREDGGFFSSGEESAAAQAVPAGIISSEKFFANEFNTMVQDYLARKTGGDKIEVCEVDGATATLQNEGNASSEDLDCSLPRRLPSDIRVSWRKFMSAILADPARKPQVEQGTFGIRGQVMNVKHAGNSHIVRQGPRASDDAPTQDYDSSSKEIMGDTELSSRNHTNDTHPTVESWKNDTDNSTNYIHDTHFSGKNDINDTEASRKDHPIGTDQSKTDQTDLLNEQSALRQAHETCFKGGSSQRHGQKHGRHRRLTNAASGGSIAPSRRSATKIRAQRSVDQLIPVSRYPSEIFKFHHEEYHPHTFPTKDNSSNIKKVVSSNNESNIGVEDQSILEASSVDNVKDYLKVFRKSGCLDEVKSLQETEDTDNNSNKLWDRARSDDVLVGDRKAFFPSRFQKRVGKIDYSEEGSASQQHGRLLYEQSSLENDFSCDKDSTTNKLVHETGSKDHFHAGQSGNDFGHKSAQSRCARIFRGKQCISSDAVDYRKWKSCMKDSQQRQFVAEITRKQRWDRIARDEGSELTSLDIQSAKRRGQPEDFYRKEAVSVNNKATVFRHVCKQKKAVTYKRIFPGGNHNCIQHEQSTLFRTQLSDGQLQHGSIIPKYKYKLQPPSVHSVKSCQSKCFLLTADSSANSASIILSSPSPYGGFQIRKAAERQLKKNGGKRVCRAPVHNIQTRKHKHQSVVRLQATRSAITAKAKVRAQTYKPTMQKQRAVLKSSFTKNPSPSCAAFTHTHSGQPSKFKLQKKQSPHETLVSLSGCNQSWLNRLDELNSTHAEGRNLQIASSICPTQAEIRPSQKPCIGFSYLVPDSSDVESRLLVEPSRRYHRSKQHANIRIKPPKEDSFVGKIVKMFEKKFKFMPSDDGKRQTDDELSGEL